MSSPIAILNASALATMMFAMGLRVGLADLMESARPARRLIPSLVANFALIPAVTLVLLRVFRPDPMVSAGFLILAACPGAPVGPPITGLARGDVPRSLGMMLILAGFSAFLTPALLGVLLPVVTPATVPRVDAPGIVRILLATQLLPLALGLGFRQASPAWARYLAGPIGLLANALLLALVVAIVATQGEMLAAIRPRAWAGMGLLLAASLGIGWACGGPDFAGRKALATTSATRNVAVGLAIATGGFADTPAVTAVVAYGLFSILGALGCALLVGRLGALEPESVRNGPSH